MTVGTDQRFARFAETLQMYLMTDAVARSAEVQSVLLRHRLNKSMIVSVLETGLQGIVVDIRNRKFCFDSRYTHGFKF